MVNGINNFIHREQGPIHVDETLFLIGSGALFGEAAIGTIGATTLRVMNQQIYAPVYCTPIHPSVHQIEGEGRGVAHFGIAGTLDLF
jgi:hypothetical protein